MLSASSNIRGTKLLLSRDFGILFCLPYLFTAAPQKIFWKHFDQSWDVWILLYIPGEYPLSYRACNTPPSSLGAAPQQDAAMCRVHAYPKQWQKLKKNSYTIEAGKLVFCMFFNETKQTNKPVLYGFYQLVIFVVAFLLVCNSVLEPVKNGHPCYDKDLNWISTGDTNF